jgi:L-fucose isomerase-like protein
MQNSKGFYLSFYSIVKKGVLMDRPKIGVIPIGKLTSSDIKEDFEFIRSELEQMEAEAIVSNPVFKQIEVVDSAKKLHERNIDLLLLIPLHGAASEQQVLAAEACNTFTLIWSLPSRYSLPSGAIAYGALIDKGFKVKYVYGSPGAQIRNEIEYTAMVAFAINRLKKSRIGVIGKVFAPIVSSHYDQNLLRDKLGPYIVNVNIADINDALKNTSDEEVKKLYRKISNFMLKVPEELIEKALRLHVAIKKVVEENELDAIALECWSELLRIFNTNPCLGFMDDEYIISCEGDAVGAALLLMLKYLTGKPAILLDIFSLEKNLLMMGGHCSAPASIAEDGEVLVCERSPPAMFDIKGKVVSIRPDIKWKEVTLLRISGRNLDKVHMALGEVVDINKTEFMGVKIKLLGNVDEFIENLHGHHYAIAQGNLSKQMKLLCEWLRLKLIIT